MFIFKLAAALGDWFWRINQLELNAGGALRGAHEQF